MCRLICVDGIRHVFSWPGSLITFTCNCVVCIETNKYENHYHLLHVIYPVWIVPEINSQMQVLAQLFEQLIWKRYLSQVTVNSEGSGKSARSGSLTRTITVRSIYGTWGSFRQRAATLTLLNHCPYTFKGSRTNQDPLDCQALMFCEVLWIFYTCFGNYRYFTIRLIILDKI